jgi:HD-GYP domain-containing protein (c-di-GMP phosphodiesterase class II)
MVRRAEIIAALSIATDLAMGQPVEFALKSCLLGVRLGQALGLTGEELRETYYEALLRYIGCNAETHIVAALFGDEMELRRDLAAIDRSSLVERGGVMLRAAQRVHAGTPLLAIIPETVKLLARARSTALPIVAGHCEVAERIALRLGLGSGVSANLGQFYERWDGRGLPRGLAGESIAQAVRVVALAQDLVLLSAVYGIEDALEIIKKRRGKAYDPRLVDFVIAHRRDLLVDAEEQPSWDAVLRLEPAPQGLLSEAELDEACCVFADFTDLKTPFTPGHSRAVAGLADAAGRWCGLTDADVVLLRRAALVHDLGDVAVPTSIWIKPSVLTDSERERVRLHAYYTERILARSQMLAAIGHVASLHHERLDGSGYHRGVGAQGLSPPARILAAAEAYQTKIEMRPHREPLPPEAAASALKQEMRAGRIDSEAGAAVLAVAGHRVNPVRRQLVADLTVREIDVLRLIARGQSTRQVAARLGISEKTAGNHIQNVYGKIDVSTRAGATLFAIEHGLLNAGGEVQAPCE